MSKTCTGYHKLLKTVVPFDKSIPAVFKSCKACVISAKGNCVNFNIVEKNTPAEPFSIAAVHTISCAHPNRQPAKRGKVDCSIVVKADIEATGVVVDIVSM